MKWTSGGAKVKGSSDLLQLIMLILVMTGGPIFLFALFLKVYLVPANAEDLSAQTADYLKLLDLLKPENNLRTKIHSLKKQVEAGGQQGTESLRAIVEGQLSTLQYSNFPKSAARSLGAAGKTGGGGTFEQAQEIVLKEAPLQEFFDFIARVKQTYPSVHVGSIKINRVGKGGAAAAGSGEDDRWTADITFQRYVSPAAGGSAAKGAAKPGEGEEPTETPPAEEPAK